MILDEEDRTTSGQTLGHSSTATWRQDCFQNWAIGFEKGLKICFSLAANYTSWVYEW